MFLKGADKATLQSAQIMYAETMQHIAHTLKDSKFNGKSLFDGSFADTTNVHAAHCIPDDASPLCVRYGPKLGEVINIPIARLLPGDGRKNNPSVTDTFMPLFSVNENTHRALEALGRVRAVTDADRQIIGSVQELWSDAQRRLIIEALPEGVNAEQDMVRQRVLRSFDNQAEHDRLYGAINEQDAVRLKKKVQALAPIIAFSKINQKEIEKIVTHMINTVNAEIDIVVNEPAAVNAIAMIPHDEHVNNIQKVFQGYANFLVSYRVANAGGIPHHQARLIRVLKGLKNLQSVCESSFPTALYAGYLTNSNGLKTALNVINNAINNFEEVLISLKTQKDKLEQAKIQLQTIITESNNAVDRYSNASYEEIIPQLLQLNQQNEVVGLVFSLSEKMLNAILEQVINTYHRL